MDVCFLPASFAAGLRQNDMMEVHLLLAACMRQLPIHMYVCLDAGVEYCKDEIYVTGKLLPNIVIYAMNSRFTYMFEKAS